MHDVNLNRLREAIIDPGDVDTAGRIGASTRAASDVPPLLSVDMVRLAFGLEIGPQSRLELLGRLNTDNAEIASDHEDQLLRTLTAMALTTIFTRTKYQRAVLPALAARCALHAGLPAIHPDVPSYADHYLRIRAAAVRTLSSSEPADTGDDPADLQRQAKNSNERARTASAVARELDALLGFSMRSTQGESALSVAVELANALAFVPAAPRVAELLAFKLRTDDTAKQGDEAKVIQRMNIPEHAEVPPPLQEFCPALTIEDEIVPASDVESVLERLDQLLLVREFNRRASGG